MGFVKLTEMEQVVMKCIWNSDYDMSLPNVIDMAVNKYKKDWKPQTVSTYLSHLVKKGYLRFYRVGRTFKYQALVEQEGYRAMLLKNHIEFWDNGDIDLFAQDLTAEGTVTKEQMEALVQKIK